MKVSEVYKPATEEFAPLLNTAKVDELKLWGKSLTIKDVALRTLKDADKIVVAFDSIDEVLVLNKTNAATLAATFGDDTDKWIGKKIQLAKVVRLYQQKPVPAIQVVPLP